ncbi:MAG: ABC transporter substrate-binding protein [Deltaproteobacteria bacterium]|nr:ABC transporter substrate-binding protein [Deltaproteobacteria bacterium]
MKRLILTIVLLLVLTGVAQARVYKIGMEHWIAFSPLNVAEVKGIWKGLGVEVQVVNFSSNQKMNAALEKKDIDFALDMIGSWVGLYFEGIPLTIIGETDWSNGGDKIIVKNNYDLNKMKGTTIGIYQDGPAITYFLNQYLVQNGLKPADVNMIELPPESLTNNFIADRVKIIVNYDPEAQRAVRKGKGQVVATSAQYPGCIPEGFVARTDILANLPPDDLAKIFKGWIAAVEWTNNPKNWQEYKQILNEKTFQGDLPYSENDLKEMLNATRIHDPKTQLARNKNGGGLQTYLKNLKEFLAANGLLKKDYNPEELFNNKVIVEVLKTVN